MKYGAHVYSSVPANRTININGRDYHGGMKVVSGVVCCELTRMPVFSCWLAKFQFKCIDLTGRAVKAGSGGAL